MKGKQSKSGRHKHAFLISLDGLSEDSSYGQEDLERSERQNNDQSLKLTFPLKEQLEDLHREQDNQDLSKYVQCLESRVETISEQIEKEYHQARETIFFLSKVLGRKQTQRAKIDEAVQQIGVHRPFFSEQIFPPPENADSGAVGSALDIGSISIQRVKQRIQHEWEAQLHDQIYRERRKKLEVEKKKQREADSMYKDLEKTFKKKKFLKERDLKMIQQKQMAQLEKKKQLSQKKARKEISKSHESPSQNGNNLSDISKQVSHVNGVCKQEDENPGMQQGFNKSAQKID